MLKRFFLILVTGFLLAACGAASKNPVTYTSPWQPTDLRALEAPNAANPAHDLIAAYARLTQTDLEIRVDFLGSPEPFDYDLTLALDDAPGGGGRLPVDSQADFAWDLVESFPAAGLPRAFTPDGAPAAIRPRILRDSVLDSAVIRLSRRDLPADLQSAAFQVFITPPGGTQPLDAIGPLRVHGTPPVNRANLYLAFWDALPAATPAQALRRWDGAHTGPLGQRHGLGVLLQQAADSGIPLSVMDLKRPERLAALDALGGLPQVQQMVKNGLLELPDLVYGDPRAASRSLEITRRAAGDFHLVGSPVFYGSTSLLPGGAKAAFARLNDASRQRQWQNFRLIPLPVGPDAVDGEGLALPARQSILAAALSGDPGRVVPLGGSLPQSAWGDSTTGALAFRYLAGHPWMQALSALDLLELPAQDGAPDCADLLCLPAPERPEAAPIRAALRESPPGLFTSLAWQTYLTLTDPTADDALRRLRSGYLGDLSPLLAAAQWNANPQDQARCDLPVIPNDRASGNRTVSDQASSGPMTADRQNTPLCILASPNIFLVLDPLGGRLVFAAVKDTQLVGPRSQFAVGLADPADWKPDRGPAGDPQEIPGGFADEADPYRPYTPAVQPGQITFSLPGSDIRKTYRLADTGFQAQVESPGPIQTSLPVALIDPSVLQQGGYAGYQIGETTWARYSAQIRLSAQGATFGAQAFNESLPLLRQPENPDAEYPPGHYIPFPLAVYTIQAQGGFTLRVDFLSK